MHLAFCDVSVAAIELGICFLQDARPKLKSVRSALSEGRSFIVVVGEPVVNDDVLNLSILEELDHESPGFLPLVHLGLILLVKAIMALEELSDSRIAKHRKRGKEIAVTQEPLGYILGRSFVLEKHCSWDIASPLPTSDSL